MSEFFPDIKKIEFEGKDSRNPLAFKYYDAKRMVAGKTMEDHMRFAVAYWHTFKSTGSDPFGAGVFDRPWNKGATPMAIAEDTMAANFEFITKLGVPYYCFHDRDMAPEGETFAESISNLETLVAKAKVYQKETGVKLLWATANLFSHPRDRKSVV